MRIYFERMCSCVCERVRTRRRINMCGVVEMQLEIKINADATAVTYIIKTLGAKCECDDTLQEQELLPDN